MSTAGGGSGGGGGTAAGRQSSGGSSGGPRVFVETQPSPGFSMGFALEHLRKAAAKMPPEERGPEMDLLLQGLEASAAAEEQLRQAAASRAQLLHSTQLTASTHPLLFKGLANFMRDQGLAIAGGGPSGGDDALFKVLMRANLQVGVCEFDPAVGAPTFKMPQTLEGWTPLAVLQVLCVGITMQYTDAGAMQKVLSMLSKAIEIVWPAADDAARQQVQSALASRQWVPTVDPLGSSTERGHGGAGGGGHSSSKATTPLAAALAADLAQHCPDVSLADMHAWALVLRLFVGNQTDTKSIPASTYQLLMTDCQQLLSGGGVAACPQALALGTQFAVNLGVHLPATGRRGELLAWFLHHADIEAMRSKCWLAASKVELFQALAYCKTAVQEEQACTWQERQPQPRRGSGQLGSGGSNRGGGADEFGAREYALTIIARLQGLQARLKPWLPAALLHQLAAERQAIESMLGQQGAASLADRLDAALADRSTTRPACAACGIQVLQLSRCASCRSVGYCSKACQVKHWKEGGHKQECAALAAARAQRAGRGGSNA